MLGMGGFPNSFGASNAMYQFKKCASATSWHLYHDASFLTKAFKISLICACLFITFTLLF